MVTPIPMGMRGITIKESLLSLKKMFLFTVTMMEMIHLHLLKTQSYKIQELNYLNQLMDLYNFN